MGRWCKDTQGDHPMIEAMLLQAKECQDHWQEKEKEKKRKEKKKKKRKEKKRKKRKEKKEKKKMPILQKFEEEGILLNSIYGASITRISKSYKDITRKENYRKVSKMNIYVKILSEILTSQTNSI